MRALMLANKTFAAARELFENRTGKFIKTKKLLTFHCYLYVPCAARDTIFLCVRTMQFASSQSIVLVCTLYSVHMSMPFFGNTFNNTFNIYKYLYIDIVFSICYLAMEPKRFVFFPPSLRFYCSVRPKFLLICTLKFIDRLRPDLNYN